MSDVFLLAVDATALARAAKLYSTAVELDNAIDAAMQWRSDLILAGLHDSQEAKQMVARLDFLIMLKNLYFKGE